MKSKIDKESFTIVSGDVNVWLFTLGTNTEMKW